MSIHARLNTLEINISCLKEVYNQIREYYDYVPINFEPSGWIPVIKVTISGKIFMLVVILCLNFVLYLKIFMNI